MDDKLDPGSTPGKTTEPCKEQGDTPNLIRRRLTGAGVAAPALLTLAARPAWGGHCTISAMMSGNLSQPQDHVCEGCTPGYWGQHPFKWPPPYVPGSCTLGQVGQHCKQNKYNDDGTPFHTMHGGPFAGNLFGALTMMQVIHLGGNGDPYQSGAHAAAALLNATLLPNFGNTPAEIIALWDTYHLTQLEEMKNTFRMLNERFCPL